MASTGAEGLAAFGAEAGGAVGGGAGLALANAPAGYIDSAIPKSQFRLRYDLAYDINRPDRATFFYGTWQELSFHPHGILNKNGTFGGVFFDPNARGPEQLPAELNMQEISSYLELAANERLSGFVEIPIRFLDFRNILEEPDVERGFREPVPENTTAPTNTPGGLGDIQVGFKYAFLADPCRYLTFQFRSYLPTGDIHSGMGTGHLSLEPGLLYYRRLDRVELQGQFRVWVPMAGGPAEGNILIYGLGLGYDVYQNGNLRVTPITEVVGWTVLNGFESIALPSPSVGLIPVPRGVDVPNSHGVEDASGDTIVNIKFGVRTYFGQHSDLYVGYGHAVTGDRWYRDIVRLEYRFSF
jgi:hypothetical protein